MAPSRRRLLLVVAGALVVPGSIACNAIIGLDDFERTECGSEPCPFDGGPDVRDDVVRPDGGFDATVDAPPGVGPVSWAEFRMPNYKEDAGIVVPPALSYELVGTDAVEDKVTFLVWRRAVIGAGFGTDFTVDDARAECEKLPNGPWRLPKRIELVTLLSHAHPAPAIDTAYFQMPSGVLAWTSSEVRPVPAGQPPKYWIVDFKTGALAQQLGTEPAKALCVKGK